MIGYRQLDVGRRAPAGGVEDWSSAVLEMAVVDRVRLRPDGTVRPG